MAVSLVFQTSSLKKPWWVFLFPGGPTKIGRNGVTQSSGTQSVSINPASNHIKCPFLPSKIEWDLTNEPLSKLLELLDTQVQGSVQWVLLEISWNPATTNRDSFHMSFYTHQESVHNSSTSKQWGAADNLKICNQETQNMSCTLWFFSPN